MNSTIRLNSVTLADAQAARPIIVSRHLPVARMDRG